MTPWWQRAVVYQIYPRSFQDTGGDGVGDLPGIIRRLDYLEWLGVDAIWLSPIFRSPMADMGYDVADYNDVDPVFGSLDDLDRLVAQAHARKIRVVLDYVPNHTSDQHPWFVESRSARDNPRRNWYVWADPAPDGGPPNNWWNHFDGGPAWTLDEGTGQYYLHLFLPQQPDLNWRNPEVEAAMFDVLRFWLDRGVDGFRVDVAAHLIKDAELRDDPGEFDGQPGHPELRTHDQPEVHAVIRRMRKVVDEYPDRVLIGEVYLPFDRLVTYYGTGDEFHIPYNFQLLLRPWEAATVRGLVERYEALLPGDAWPNWVLSNHDRPRVATRVGPSQARVATMALLTLRGTPTLYYGDELGMSDVPIPPEQTQDPQGRAFAGHSRDPARTPMQWDEGPNAGFCPPEVTPWLPLAADRLEVNVATQRADPSSMLQLTRSLLDLRQSDEALQTGPYTTLPAPRGVLAYRRGQRWAIGLNLTHQPRRWRPPGDGRVALSTHGDRGDEKTGRVLDLRPDEGVVLDLG